MIKKFLKAVIMGLRNSEVINIAKLFVMIGWLPMLVTLILEIFKINVSDEEMILGIFTTAILGAMIFMFICHCIDAMKYQEENKCDFNEAWKATSGCEEDDDF